MSKFEDLKLAEVEALGNFCEQIEEILRGMDEYRLFLDKKDIRKYNKTYQNLVYFWEQLQDRLIYLWDADERSKQDER